MELERWFTDFLASGAARLRVPIFVRVGYGHHRLECKPFIQTQ